MRQIAAALIICWSAALCSTQAAAQDGRFESYEDLRELMDPLVMSRSIQEAMSLFGASNQEDAAKIQNQLQQVYPKDFENHTLISRDELSNGWRQEVIAYWVDTQYLYVYLLMHQRDDALVNIKFQFHNDILQLNKAF